MTVLPFLWQDFKAGLASRLMVSRKYANLLEGVSYCNPIIFDGEPHDLTGAVELAKKTGMDWVVCQVNGRPEDTKQLVYERTEEFRKGLGANAMTDSWVKEVFRAAGMWGHWRRQPPLVFDRRSKEREQALLDAHMPSGKKRPILVATSAETAPFRYKELLMELLDGRFRKNFRVVDLDSFRADRIYDLLGLFDRAKCLISTDSALLHLANASKVPVLALVNDRPSLWFGSAWRPNHVFYCRYGDFGSRVMEMLETIEHIGSAGRPLEFREGPRKFIHIWSQYEVNDDNRDRHERAQKSWHDQYLAGHWIETKIEVGACGRDSKNAPMRDSTRFPFVRDVIQAAEMRAREDDVIVMTPADVSFNGAIGSIEKFPCWGCRTDRAKDGDTHNPRIDFLAFTAGWWKANRKDYPDFVMGPDNVWSKVLKELIRSTGGVEVEGATFKES